MNAEIAALEREIAQIELQIPVATEANKIRLMTRLRDLLQRKVELVRRDRMYIDARNAVFEDILRQRQNE